MDSPLRGPAEPGRHRYDSDKPDVSELHSRLRLPKYEALGNDYLVLDDAARFDAVLPLVPRLCDRHRGIGSDGLLLVDPASRHVRIINPDGSEAEKSGNGLRIAAAHLVLAHGAPGGFTLHVPGGDVPVAVRGARGAEVETEIGLGIARVSGPERIEAGVEGYVVDVGNPHFVVFGGPVTAERAQELGPRIERDPRFPNRTNVQLAERAGDGIRIEIWERGAGYTLGSGTSAAAAAAAAMHAGLCASPVRVEMPGGSLSVERDADGSLSQRASARRVFVAEVALGDL